MLNDDAPSYHYRAGYNPDFIRKLQEKREQERRRKLRAEAAKERRRIEKEHSEIKQAVQAARDAAKREQEEAARIELQGRVPVKDIIAHVAHLHLLKPDDLIGPRRMKHIIAARHEAIRVTANLRPDLSLPQIGRAFNKDHTTILHALRKTQQAGDPR